MAQSYVREIMRRMAQGDQGALAELYDRFAALANGIALRVLRDVSEAEDVVQEVFVQAWRQASRYDPGRGSPEAWLCTIARTRALDRLRRRVARREEPADGPSMGASRPATEAGVAVRTALSGLPPEQRHALELAYWEGLTQTEIADRLGEPLGTVKTRIRTAMIRLRDTLKPVDQ